MTAHSRTIAHFDLDSFFVSVECRKDPSLRGKPVAVGGQSDRGVISSCSYEARKLGVRSAMPVKQAKRLCPELLMVKGSMEEYSLASREITQIIAEHVPLFEKSSIDEFYIDLTGMDRFFGCVSYTTELRQKIMREMKLPISFGLSSNKLVSKIATNEAKPNGQRIIPRGTEKQFLAPLKVEKIPMAGVRTTELLRRMGIITIRDLCETPVELLTLNLGQQGTELWKRANGIDDSPVSPYHEQKSLGTEHTLHADTSDADLLLREITRMTEQLAFELRQHNRLAGCVTIKIRYSDFHTFTRQSAIPYTSSDHNLLQVARHLFDKSYDRKQQLRLIGVRFSQLIPGCQQVSLFDDTEEVLALYKAIDRIKMEFGEGKLVRAAGALYSPHKPER